MDEAKRRAWWWKRQGFGGELAGASPAEVLERAGWARSVGGCSPYLTAFGRAGISREAMDEALARLEVHELPSARGCTYVVPARDFALALKVGQAFDGELATARKLGVTDKELDRLAAKVVAALGKGPLAPDELREAVGDAARSLGPEGKKKGVTTTMPVALGRLQSEGEIRRVPVNGRLDQQRYRYALWKPSPLARSTMSAEEAYTALARRYFAWIGPATCAEFQWFSGLGVKAAKAAIAPLELVPVEPGGDALLLPEDVEAFHATRPPAKADFALVAGLDSLVLLRRDFRALVDADGAREELLEEPASARTSVVDLASHAILDRGRLVGLWEFDEPSQKIVHAAFGVREKKDEKALAAAIERTLAFVKDQLGDARSFSLDNPKSRAPRIEALRKAAKR